MLGAVDFVRFREDVRRERKRRKWNQRTLAEKAGLALATVNRLELGQHTQELRTLMAVAGALKLSLQDYEDSPMTSPVPGADDTAAPEAGMTDVHGRLISLIKSLDESEATMVLGVVRVALGESWTPHRSGRTTRRVVPDD